MVPPEKRETEPMDASQTPKLVRRPRRKRSTHCPRMAESPRAKGMYSSYCTSPYSGCPRPQSASVAETWGGTRLNWSAAVFPIAGAARAADHHRGVGARLGGRRGDAHGTRDNPLGPLSKVRHRHRRTVQPASRPDSCTCAPRSLAPLSCTCASISLAPLLSCLSCGETRWSTTFNQNLLILVLIFVCIIAASLIAVFKKCGLTLPVLAVAGCVATLGTQARLPYASHVPSRDTIHAAA